MDGPFVSCSSQAVLQLGQRVAPIGTPSTFDASSIQCLPVSTVSRLGPNDTRTVPLDVHQPEESAQPVGPGNKRRRLGGNVGESGGEWDDGDDAVEQEAPQPLPLPLPKPGKGSGGGPSLGDMVAVGVLIPGRDCLSVTYKGVKYTASLMEDGSILFQDKRFNSPSAFSVHVKRLQTPNKQGDDGWKSVYIGGLALDEYRKQYRCTHMDPTKQPGQQLGAYGQQPQQVLQQAYGQHTAARPPKQKARKKVAEPAPVVVVPQQYVEVLPQLETAHWVQCGRCETWRIVPDEHWLAVESDTREDWFCEDAWWDVAALEPYTAPCRGRG